MITPTRARTQTKNKKTRHGTTRHDTTTIKCTRYKQHLLHRSHIHRSTYTRTVFVFPEGEPMASMAWTMSMPSTTLPKTTCFPSSQGQSTVHKKNCNTKVQKCRSHAQSAIICLFLWTQHTNTHTLHGHMEKRIRGTLASSVRSLPKSCLLLTQRKIDVRTMCFLACIRAATIPRNQPKWTQPCSQRWMPTGFRLPLAELHTMVAASTVFSCTGVPHGCGINSPFRVSRHSRVKKVT